MATIWVGNARIGMRVSRDIYTSSGMKLFIVGTVLTKENLQMLKNHNVQQIEVNEIVKTQAISSEKLELHKMIKKIPLFASFSKEHLEQLLEGSRIERRPAQTIIFQQKDPGICFYIIIDGSVKIYTHSNRGDEKILSILKTGDSFGELSLLDGKPRSASAQALEETSLISISRDSFMKVLQSNFDLAREGHVISRAQLDVEEPARCYIMIRLCRIDGIQ